MNLEELIRQLLAHSDHKEVVAALQAHAQPIWQLVWNAGHKRASDEGKTKKAELEARIAELDGELGTARTTISDLEKKQPDLAKIRADHAAELQKVRDRAKADLDALNGKLTGERKRVAMATLKDKLGKGLDPDYAEVQVAKLEAAGRIRFREDGGVEVLQADGATPYAPATGQDPLDLLTAEVVKAAPPKFQVGSADRGAGGPAAGGAAGSGASGGAGNGGPKTAFDRIRDEVKAKETTAAPAAGSAAQRLGVIPATGGGR